MSDLHYLFSAFFVIWCALLLLMLHTVNKLARAEKELKQLNIADRGTVQK